VLLNEGASPDRRGMTEYSYGNFEFLRFFVLPFLALSLIHPNPQAASST
jgi:hypothetical protein